MSTAWIAFGPGPYLFLRKHLCGTMSPMGDYIANDGRSEMVIIRNLSILDPRIFELGRLVLVMPVRRCREQ
jgi:hypothetical protein